MKIRGAAEFASEPTRPGAIHVTDFRVKILTDVCIGGVYARKCTLPIATEIQRVRVAYSGFVG